MRDVKGVQCGWEVGKCGEPEPNVHTYSIEPDR